ncbi:MGH1-like glycoside hydrolase domain-containing protein [Microbacter margulisiae]|uniref:Six-hairpin glycosidase n=1 Tax=Microbacter margulisiae TaxID=1350067 RepID=A0A7W5DQA1_9PORP|nr:glycosyl hydrolase family 65 protein [Microbacter margulisiae]MBB3186991.1 hypothetical protein [Microbacter margulisiae]
MKHQTITYLVTIILAIFSSTITIHAQDGIYYTGTTLSNVNYHDGQLPLAVGVHNIQVLRANREHPALGGGVSWTYNHAPMLAYWNHQFYLEYLSDPVGESVPPGRTLLLTSKDGYRWSNPVIIFPQYRVPDGTTKPDSKIVAKHLWAVMHQRMGFYVSKSHRLLVLGFYGICLGPKDHPNDGNGIGRVVREVFPNGKFGPIYFIRYNHGFSQKNTTYPFYTQSKDQGFVDACNELLSKPLMMQQWNEEADRNDPLIPLKLDFKAFDYYHLPNGNVVGLWKCAVTSISKDNGRTWLTHPQRAQGFVNGNAKIWGQRTSDGRYSTVYNPSSFYRWPLAISTSNDGLNYNDMYLVHGDLTPMRYGGNFKNPGPQYVRGIIEGNGTPPDGDEWVTYSMNKEDIWVSRIPVPVTDRATAQANDDFNNFHSIAEMTQWNIYSPLWAPVSIEKRADGRRWLTLQDWDPFDYAKAERVIPTSKKLTAEFTIVPGQNNKGELDIEFENKTGQPCIRLIFDKDKLFKAQTGPHYSTLAHYQGGEVFHIELALDATTNSYTMVVNGKKISTHLFFNPVASVSRIVFRTGELPIEPTPDSPAFRYTDLPHAGSTAPKAVFYIKNLKTVSLDDDSHAAVLKADEFKHFVDFFNSMENENITLAISNAQSWDWMKKNIPLFECPQYTMEQMYYYRWWTYRKHIEKTPVGYAITEFLVPRHYADKYNLISCALGHHIYEGRWLRDRQYVDDDIHVWYRGNDGKPMKKLRNYSSWATDAIYNKYLVDGDTTFLLNMYPDLKANYAAWESDHRLHSGLFWQSDVQDGMEESISGGRRKHYARPTINSYMYGNAKALSEIAALDDNQTDARFYQLKADTLKSLVQNLLWNKDSLFFETLRKPGEMAQVREEIGFLPWYFNLPDKNKGYDAAWKQITNPRGFYAPFGITTAEQRNPEFRTHGVGNCEWDGAVWPFATSQTLTAMENLINNYPQTEMNDSIYFARLEQYVECQSYRGRPYIGEYLDQRTGYWLKGDQERSRYYNHSTFNDLIITGLVGLRPRPDNTIEINPLLPKHQWNWFCLDNVLYHGKNLTIVWDKTGGKYELGKGLMLFINGHKVASRPDLGKLTYTMK